MLAGYGVVQAGRDGWESSATLGCLGGSVVGVLAFVALESRLAHPLIPLHVFRYRNLARANIVQVEDGEKLVEVAHAGQGSQRLWSGPSGDGSEGLD